MIVFAYHSSKEDILVIGQDKYDVWRLVGRARNSDWATKIDDENHYQIALLQKHFFFSLRKELRKRVFKSQYISREPCESPVLRDRKIDPGVTVRLSLAGDWGINAVSNATMLLRYSASALTISHTEIILSRDEKLISIQESKWEHLRIFGNVRKPLFWV